MSKFDLLGAKLPPLILLSELDLDKYQRFTRSDEACKSCETDHNLLVYFLKEFANIISSNYELRKISLVMEDLIFKFDSLDKGIFYISFTTSQLYHPFSDIKIFVDKTNYIFSKNKTGKIDYISYKYDESAKIEDKIVYIDNKGRKCTKRDQKIDEKFAPLLKILEKEIYFINIYGLKVNKVEYSEPIFRSPESAAYFAKTWPEYKEKYPLESDVEILGEN